MNLDLDGLVSSVLQPIKGYIDKTFAAFSDGSAKLSERIARLEAVAEKGHPEPLPGRDADPALMQRMVDVAVKAIPPAKDGIDGLGFDDLSVHHDGERGVTLRFTNGDKIKEFAFTIPSMIFRGVYKQDAAYEQGDAVTWGGSCWVALKDTSNKPGTCDAWQLAVKRGRDGKDSSEPNDKSKSPVHVAFNKGAGNG